MYPEPLVAPMRKELTRLGIDELRTPQEVDSTLREARGTTLVVVTHEIGFAREVAEELGR